MGSFTERLPLFLNEKRVFSDYQLLGDDENSLTYALGHCLSYDKAFLSSFLRKCKFRGVTSKNVCHAEIHLQKRQDGLGIVDLEILIKDRLQLIIEAKVRGGYPDFDQVETYINRLVRRGIQSKVVVLTEVTDDKKKNILKKRFGKRIGFLMWSDVLELSTKLAEYNNATFDIRSFAAFMKEVYGMILAVEEEVWIVPLSTKWKAKTKNISAAELHVKYAFWVMGDKKSRRSLYMGFRYNGHLQYIGRIKKIDYELKSSQIGPKIAEEFWGPKGEPWDVVRLESLIPFPKKLPSGNIHNKHIYCDFDLLLTSNSILEAESMMIKRREQKQLPL